MFGLFTLLIKHCHMYTDQVKSTKRVCVTNRLGLKGSFAFVFIFKEKKYIFCCFDFSRLSHKFHLDWTNQNKGSFGVEFLTSENSMLSHFTITTPKLFYPCATTKVDKEHLFFESVNCWKSQAHVSQLQRITVVGLKDTRMGEKEKEKRTTYNNACKSWRWLKFSLWQTVTERGGRGAGGLKIPLPVPHIPSSHPSLMLSIYLIYFNSKIL